MPEGESGTGDEDGVHASTGTDPDADPDPEPDPPEPDPPEPHAICDYDNNVVYSFTIEEYTEQLSAVLDGWTCDGEGGTGFDDGGEGSDGSGSSDSATGGATWDDVPIVCGIMCNALTCEDALVPNECLSVNWTECGWSDPDDEGVRTMTCCYNTDDHCP